MRNVEINEIYQKKPLLGFSLYTQVQVETLERLAVDLSRISATWEQNNLVNDFQIYYGNFWLWTLGAYEVVRTMRQHRDCFSKRVQDEMDELNRSLKLMRVPFAKQELDGGRGPIYAELSVVGVKNGLVFWVRGNEVNSADLIQKTMTFFTNIQIEDVVGTIPTNWPDDHPNKPRD